jgi:hypothetical protein
MYGRNATSLLLRRLPMPISAEILKTLIEREMATVSDARVIAHIRGMLVEPHAVLLGWDYGEPGQQYLCWMVLKDVHSGGEIAYSEYGFGPRSPWGLVTSGYPHMGMDPGWFTTFLDAFFESAACLELPIWRAIYVDPDGTRIPVTDEGPWEPTWRQIFDLRSRDQTRRYDCGHSINYGH